MKIKKFQEGGQVASPEAMPIEGGAPAGPAAAPQGGEDPIMAIAQLFAQGLQNQDCQALAQGAQMFLELMQQASAGAEGQPVFAKGGKMVARKPASFKLVCE